MVKVGLVGFGENFPEFADDGLKLVNGPSRALVDPPEVNTNFIETIKTFFKKWSSFFYWFVKLLRQKARTFSLYRTVELSGTVTE